MYVNHPNRAGQSSCVFKTGSPDYIEVSSGTALDLAYLIPDAMSEAGLISGARVGVYIEKSGSYKIWTAIYDPALGRLTKELEERTVGLWSNNDAVTVRITLTANTLKLLSAAPGVGRFVTVTGTTYTLTAADAGSTIRFTSASDVTVSISSTIPFVTGSEFQFQVQLIREGDGKVSLVPSGADTINGTTLVELLTKYSGKFLYKVGATTLVTV